MASAKTIFTIWANCCATVHETPGNEKTPPAEVGLKHCFCSAPQTGRNLNHLLLLLKVAGDYFKLRTEVTKVIGINDIAHEFS